MRITYRDVPDEIVNAIAPSLAAWEPVAPRWIERLSVVLSSDDDAALSCTVRPEYLAMTLFVHPAWLVQDAEKRHADVLHEIIHAPLERARDVFLNVMRSSVDETSPLWDWSIEEYRKAMESAVCDLEHAILRLVE